jgi:hypothetical protein
VFEKHFMGKAASHLGHRPLGETVPEHLRTGTASKIARTPGGAVAAAMLAALATIADASITWWAIRRGHSERNPLAAAGFDRVGLELILGLAVLVRFAIVGGLLAVARVHTPRVAPGIATVALVVVAAWWSIIVVTNVHMLAA